MHQLHRTFEMQRKCAWGRFFSMFIFNFFWRSNLEKGKLKKKKDPQQQAAGSVLHVQSVEHHYHLIFSFQTLAPACGKFAPFEIKENVSLAPLCRVQCEESVLEELDRCLLNQYDNGNALKDWIGQKPRRSGPTKPRQSKSMRWGLILFQKIFSCIFPTGLLPVTLPRPFSFSICHRNYLQKLCSPHITCRICCKYKIKNSCLD